MQEASAPSKVRLMKRAPDAGDGRFTEYGNFQQFSTAQPSPLAGRNAVRPSALAGRLKIDYPFPVGHV
jgi:hypothetical protein